MRSCSWDRHVRRRHRSGFTGRRSSPSPTSPPHRPPSTRSSSRAEALAATGRTRTTGASSPWQNYEDLRERDPSFQPARPVVPAYSRQPFDVVDPVPVITDPGTRQVAEAAALGYELVVHLRTRFFTHTDETDEQLDVLVNCAIDTMAGVVRPLATTLTTLPVGPGHPGCTAGFSFEMFYAMGNLVPWREPAWALLQQRAAILAERCAELADDAAMAHEAAAENAVSLAAHVPTDLLAKPR
jgi:hypothetical protein